MGIQFCCAGNNTTTDDYTICENQKNFDSDKIKTADTLNSENRTFTNISKSPKIEQPATKSISSESLSILYKLDDSYLVPKELRVDYEKDEVIVLIFIT